MNSFPLISILLLFIELNQSQSTSHEEGFVDSLNCYKTLTLDLFKNMEKIVPKSWVQGGENEFKFKIMSKDQSDALITKDGSNKELFIEGKKLAEEIGSRTITRIHRWLSYRCDEKIQDGMKEVTKKFRDSVTGCGDPEYLSDAVTTLEQTCSEENNKKIYISKNLPSFFAGNKALSRERTWDKIYKF